MDSFPKQNFYAGTYFEKYYLSSNTYLKRMRMLTAVINLSYVNNNKKNSTTKSYSTYFLFAQLQDIGLRKLRLFTYLDNNSSVREEEY